MHLRHFPEKPFQAPKIIFKSLKLICQVLLSYGHLLRGKRLKFTFLRDSNHSGFGTWKFTAKEDLNRRKQVFLHNFRRWPAQKPNIWSTFYGKKFIQENYVLWKLGAFGLKTDTFARLLFVASYPCLLGTLSHLLWPSGWHVTSEA